VAPAKPTGNQNADYPPVSYINGYNATLPLGGKASIDPRTGIISGIAPPLGQYVVSVLIKEKRNGVQIGEHRKDFILRVQDCDIASAKVEPNYPICDLPSFQFKNLAPASPLIKTYYWEFGQGGTIVGTSNAAEPLFTFPNPGVYTVKLVINRGDACENSSEGVARVWPGFKPDFDINGICIQKNSDFIDKTTTNGHGSVNSWSWDFGEPSSTTDVSTARNPSYRYPAAGMKNVKLTVGSDRGCSGTITKQIEIYAKPPLQLITKDTLMCNGDTTQLSVTGNGNFTWTPVSRIQGENTATPLVWPNVTTTYFVRLDDNGCINEDSIKVRVVNFVTLEVMPDTTICLTDSVQLRANTNGLRIQWQPAVDIDLPDIANPKAKPKGTTDYTITSRIGKCVDEKTITVKTVPYPVVDAGADTTICFNATAQLHGSTDGTQFSWSPVQSLLNANTLTPQARPLATTRYILTATKPLSGCPKPSRDTVIVTVLPKINAFAGNDTAVVLGQPLQLNATGGNTYIWSPATALSSTTIPNPVGLYDGSFETIRYKLIATIDNCSDSAYVNVKIFKTPAQVFVPTGFTPNRDGKNDIIRPIAVGITKIEYFRIYNRWGQQVFQTVENGKGWDGRIKGQDQGSGVYVWVVKAIDFTGKEFFAKGTLTLIR
jgi:gliding motility-associated-like protein